MKNKESLIVFLADDDLEDQKLFKKCLEQIETKVHLKVFDNAEDLLIDLASTNTNPDLIFLDLYMPSMDGEDCLIEIRSNSDFKSIPIVIYSSELDLDRIEELFALGANRYLRKPISYKSLVASISKTIESVKRNAIGGNTVINIIV